MSDWPTSPFVHEWIRAHADERPGSPAIGTPDHGWTTYRELDTAITTAAAQLAEHGVDADSIVIQALPPSAASVAIGYAVQLIGATLVEVDRNLAVDQLAAIIDHTGSSVAVGQGRDTKKWVDVAGASALKTLCVVHPDEPPARMADLLAAIDWTWLPLDPGELASMPIGRPAPPATRTADDMALLVYTSGSTSQPRGVIQTHGNIDANSRAIARYLGLTPDDRAMATLPLFYCYGRSVLQTHLLVGGSVFFDHRFMYPSVVLDEMVEQGCTGFAGVPLTFENLQRSGDIERRDLGALRYITQAGGAMRSETTEWARRAFAPAELFVMYGQTEATARLTYVPPAQAAAKRGAAGIALDNIELAIVDEHGQPQGVDVEGHVVASGPSITPGYFRAPDETAEILQDGRLWTGDIGRIDSDGFLFLTGRAKEVLKLAGNRVSPVEIEEILAAHDAVDEVAVAGGVDSTGNEHAIAFVIGVEGADTTEDDLRRHCRQIAPAFKVPTRVRFVDSLPYTASGKVARKQLQELIKDDPHLLP